MMNRLHHRKIILPNLVQLRFYASAIVNVVVLVSCLCFIFVSGGFTTSAHAQRASLPFIIESKPEVEKLLKEAQQLFQDQNSIDARSKLQEALAIDPNDIQVNRLLGLYYLVEIKHHKLAHRYISNALKNFEKNYGSKPSSSFNPIWGVYANLLMLMSEAELSLDHYQLALDYLKKFEKYFNDSSIAATEAWILMKLGKREEAIEVCKKGLRSGADPTRTYNVLGILYSVTGKLDLSIKAFNSSIDAEKAKGNRARLSTPLNNLAEVYRELFKEPKSEEIFEKSISESQDCDHSLPSVNLAMMLIDQMRLRKADRVLTDFENCFNQNPLKEDSEHKMLLSLMKGRVLFRSGLIEKAIASYEKANDNSQSFGRIGSSINDLKVAAKLDLAMSLYAKANRSSMIGKPGLIKEVKNYLENQILKIRADQLVKEAKIILIRELDDFEDIYVRNSDSFIEYPTLSILTDRIEISELKQKFKSILETDKRKTTKKYFDLYLASNLVNKGYEKTALDILLRLEKSWKENKMLEKAETKRLILQTLDRGTKEFTDKAFEIFKIIPSYLPNHAIKTPVRLSSNSDIINDYLKDMFYFCGKQLECKLNVVVVPYNSGNKIIFKNEQEVIADTEISNKCLQNSECLYEKITKFYSDVFYKLN